MATMEERSVRRRAVRGKHQGRSRRRWRFARAGIVASIAAAGLGSADLSAAEATAPDAQFEPTADGAGQFLVVDGLLDSGTMPDAPAVGIEAAAAQRWTGTVWRLHLIAGATFFPQQDMGNPMLADVPSGRYWMVSFSGRGCVTAVLSRFEIGPCLGGEVAVMHASKLNGLPMTDSTQSWASPLGSAIAAFTVAPRVILFARTDVVVPITRRSFLSDRSVGYFDVYKVPTFALRGAVGIELRLF
jgi:hypothetical protein